MARKQIPSPVKKRRRAPAKPRARQTQLISLPLGRQAKLVLTVSRPARIKTKQKPAQKTRTKSGVKASKRNSPKKTDMALSIAILLVGLIGSIFFGLQATASPTPPFNVTRPEIRRQTPTQSGKNFFLLSASVPSQLRIPAIAVDAAITPIGLQPDGTIAVPSQSDMTGWYNMSPTPGEKGTSIIVGHVDSLSGPAVFWRLGELLPGQIIEVSREDGKTAHFAVDKVQKFARNNFPAGEVYGNTEYAGLRLITCGGAFDPATRHYSDNVVVFATLLPS